MLGIQFRQINSINLIKQGYKISQIEMRCMMLVIPASPPNWPSAISRTVKCPEAGG
jgi:hypothetical protein